MTIEHRRVGTTVRVTWVACPFCDDPIPDGLSFRQHWRGCSASATETTQ